MTEPLPPASMKALTAADIQRPSICRMVVLHRKDEERFPLPTSHTQSVMLVRQMPATVIGIVVEENLTIDVMSGNTWYRAPHSSLCDVGMPGPLAGDTMVWSWPPRS